MPLNKKNEKTETNKKFSTLSDKFSTAITELSGNRFSFVIALVVVLGWAVSGPVFGYSEKWQLAINSITSIVTFLMVFLIQQSQNKNTNAQQLKLNELIAANKFASNRLVSAENMTVEELKELKEFYTNVARFAAEDKDLFSSHSLDKAETIQAVKDNIKKHPGEDEEKDNLK